MEIISDLLNISDLLFQDRESKSGCLRLENLTMQSCDCITESGIRFILENYKNLRTLVYHQRRSVFEIIIKWCSEMEQKDFKANQVKLEQLEHGFPYGITPFRSVFKQKTDETFYK